MSDSILSFKTTDRLRLRSIDGQVNPKTEDFIEPWGSTKSSGSLTEAPLADGAAVRYFRLRLDVR